MSQAVANTKQFAATTKGKDIRTILPAPSRPPVELNNSAKDLRKKKKLYKAGKGELDVEATKALREKVAAQKYGRYFDDPNLRSRQFSDEAVTEAKDVIRDFRRGPYAADEYGKSAPIKVKSERVNAIE